MRTCRNISLTLYKATSKCIKRKIFNEVDFGENWISSQLRISIQAVTHHRSQACIGKKRVHRKDPDIHPHSGRLSRGNLLEPVKQISEAIKCIKKRASKPLLISQIALPLPQSRIEKFLHSHSFQTNLQKKLLKNPFNAGKFKNNF